MGFAAATSSWPQHLSQVCTAEGKRAAATQDSVLSHSHLLLHFPAVNMWCFTDPSRECWHQGAGVFTTLSSLILSFLSPLFKIAANSSFEQHLELPPFCWERFKLSSTYGWHQDQLDQANAELRTKLRRLLHVLGNMQTLCTTAYGSIPFYRRQIYPLPLLYSSLSSSSFVKLFHLILPLHPIPSQHLNPRLQGLPCPMSCLRAAPSAAGAGARPTRGKKPPSSADRRCEAHKEPPAANTGGVFRGSLGSTLLRRRTGHLGIQDHWLFSALRSRSLGKYFYSTSGHVKMFSDSPTGLATLYYGVYPGCSKGPRGRLMAELRICSCGRSHPYRTYMHPMFKRNAREGGNQRVTWFSKRFC